MGRGINATVNRIGGAVIEEANRMYFRSNPWSPFAFQRGFPPATLLAALGLAVIFLPLDMARGQTGTPPASAAQTPAPGVPGENPQADVKNSTSQIENITQPPSDIAQKPVPVPNPVSSTLPHDLSPWGMFLAADIIVKAVMVGLAFASLVTWTVGLAKGIELMLAKRRARSALARLAAAPTLQAASDTLDHKSGPVPQFVNAAFMEAERSVGMPFEGVKDRAAALLTRLEQRAGRSMTRGTGVLATIGATAPFVGLFGTVWGIMNSFIGISKANTTNLAVVAPGIAEALLATALGLVAAIPAVVIYNLLARSITSYRALLADTSTEVMRHLSRDLDRQLFEPEDDDGRVVAMRRSAE